MAFHCHAGRGRTGTLLAAMLIWYRPDFARATQQIKATNRHWIETQSQMEFLELFARRRQSSRAVRKPDEGTDNASPKGHVTQETGSRRPPQD